jgi:23S rRNA pseudouridine1911/1915/1917 synthase
MKGISRSVVHKVVVSDELDGERLDKALAALVPAVSRTLARKAIGAGAVRVDGKRVRIASRPVNRGSRIEAGVDHEVLSQEPVPPPEVLRRGEGWWVVLKPPGQHVQGTALGDRATLERTVNQEIIRGPGGEAWRREGKGVHLVHRLDADASGVMVIALNPRVADQLTEQINSRRMERRYLALVEGAPEEAEGTIDRKLTPRVKGRVRVADDGRVAVTRYETRAVYPEQDRSLVEAQLRTGRTHQIRVHFAEALGAIQGDRLYGRGRKGDRLCLHAWHLSFDDPADGSRVVVENLPDEGFYVVSV